MELLNQACRLAEGASFPALRSFLLANRAQQLAAANRGLASYRDLDKAAHLSSLGESSDVDVLAGWDELRLAAYRGICAMVLERPAEVIAITEPVLARTDPSRVQRSLQQSDLAAAYAMQGDIDQASSMLHEALAAAARAQLPEGVQRALGVRAKYLSAHGQARPVRELDELIATITL